MSSTGRKQHIRASLENVIPDSQQIHLGEERVAFSSSLILRHTQGGATLNADTLFGMAALVMTLGFLLAVSSALLITCDRD